MRRWNAASSSSSAPPRPPPPRARRGRSATPSRACYTRARLVDEKGAPLRAKAIPANRNLIFHYPFAVDALLPAQPGQARPAPVQLKTADNQPYEWHGGVGAGALGRRVFGDLRPQALLPDARHQLHQLPHREERAQPARQRDPLLLGAQPVRPGGGRARWSPAPRRSRSPRSCWNGMPARDEIYAVGTLGGEMFNEFFAEVRLQARARARRQRRARRWQAPASCRRWTTTANNR